MSNFETSYGLHLEPITKVVHLPAFIFPLKLYLSRRLLTNIANILFHLCDWHSIYIEFNL